MTRPALRTVPRAARWPRMLLLAAVLLGIVTMHTLGHPDESHASSMGKDGSGAHFVAPPSHDRHQPDHPMTEPEPLPLVEPGAGPAAGLRAEAPVPGTGMDPMAVCLAVLAGLTLFLLGRTFGVRNPAARAAGCGPAVRTGGGPDPPAGRELLARLAVLRV
ncbi:hypothetical protein [Streptomyces sp. NPDC002054]|uniref:hypothetical protein n=1 Tax=Streptomyces sp. NPDC002054 TaxID=3154663 RepID=UPI00331D8E62